MPVVPARWQPTRARREHSPKSHVRRAQPRRAGALAAGDIRRDLLAQRDDVLHPGVRAADVREPRARACSRRLYVPGARGDAPRCQRLQLRHPAFFQRDDRADAAPTRRPGAPRAGNDAGVEAARWVDTIRQRPDGSRRSRRPAALTRRGRTSAPTDPVEPSAFAERFAEASNAQAPADDGTRARVLLLRASLSTQSGARARTSGKPSTPTSATPVRTSSRSVTARGSRGGHRTQSATHLDRSSRCHLHLGLLAPR